jgi:DNA-binding transcriptional ArsR family regulator
MVDIKQLQKMSKPQERTPLRVTVTKEYVDTLKNAGIDPEVLVEESLKEVCAQLDKNTILMSGSPIKKEVIEHVQRGEAAQGNDTAQKNRAEILKLFEHGERLNQREVAEDSGFSPPTVSSHMKVLYDQGILVKIPGSFPQLYQLREKNMEELSAVLPKEKIEAFR